MCTKRLLDAFPSCPRDSGSHFCVCLAQGVQGHWIALGDDFRCFCRVLGSPVETRSRVSLRSLLMTLTHFYVKTDSLMLERSLTMASLPLVTAQFLRMLTGGTCSSSSCTVFLSCWHCDHWGSDLRLESTARVSRLLRRPILFPFVRDRRACCFRAARSLTTCLPLVSSLTVVRTIGRCTLRSACRFSALNVVRTPERLKIRGRSRGCVSFGFCCQELLILSLLFCFEASD